MSIRNLEVENRTKYGLLHRFWIFLKGEREKFDIFDKESSGFKVLKEKNLANRTNYEGICMGAPRRLKSCAALIDKNYMNGSLG